MGLPSDIKITFSTSLGRQKYSIVFININLVISVSAVIYYQAHNNRFKAQYKYKYKHIYTHIQYKYKYKHKYWKTHFLNSKLFSLNVLITCNETVKQFWFTGADIIFLLLTERGKPFTSVIYMLSLTQDIRNNPIYNLLCEKWLNLYSYMTQGLSSGTVMWSSTLFNNLVYFQARSASSLPARKRCGCKIEWAGRAWGRIHLALWALATLWSCH